MVPNDEVAKLQLVVIDELAALGDLIELGEARLGFRIGETL